MANARNTMNESLELVFNRLLYAKMVKNRADFAQKMGYAKSTISGLLKDSSPLSNLAQLKLNSAFPEWKELYRAEQSSPSTTPQPEPQPANTEQGIIIETTQPITDNDRLMRENTLLIETLASMQRSMEKIAGVNERMYNMLEEQVLIQKKR
jgi:hypothetical protein